MIFRLNVLILNKCVSMGYYSRNPYPPGLVEENSVDHCSPGRYNLTRSTTWRRSRPQPPPVDDSLNDILKREAVLQNFPIIDTGRYISAISRHWIRGVIQNLSKSYNFLYGTMCISLPGFFVLGLLFRPVEYRGLFFPEAHLFVLIGLLAVFNHRLVNHPQWKGMDWLSGVLFTLVVLFSAPGLLASMASWWLRKLLPWIRVMSRASIYAGYPRVGDKPGTRFLPGLQAVLHGIGSAHA
jgi:hypothetical protein